MPLSPGISALATRIATEFKTIRSTFVPNSRTISTGTGLTGGGDLSADRSLSVVYGTTSTTAARGDDARLSDARTPTTHTHTAAQISDAGARGRTVLQGADLAAVRAAAGFHVGTTAPADTTLVWIDTT